MLFGYVMLLLQMEISMNGDQMYAEKVVFSMKMSITLFEQISSVRANTYLLISIVPTQ